VLASLVRAYERLPAAAPFGYSTERIGFLVSLNENGSVAHVIDLRREGKRPEPRPLLVPQGKKRTVAIDPNFLWDKTAYKLGVTVGEGKRTAQEHAAFRQKMANGSPAKWTRASLPSCASSTAGGRGISSRRFGPRGCVTRTSSSASNPSGWRTFPARPAGGARAAWSRGERRCRRSTGLPRHRRVQRGRAAASVDQGGSGGAEFGREYRLLQPRRLHLRPRAGRQRRHSEAAAFAYTTALNRFLVRDRGHRIQIGDASTVFWADCADRTVAEAARTGSQAGSARRTTARRMPPPPGESARNSSRFVVEGRSPRSSRGSPEGVRFFVLGPAAGRQVLLGEQLRGADREPLSLDRSYELRLISSRGCT
jgi:CRISPR-associated protein Csd1